MNKRLIAGILVVLIIISIGVTVGMMEYKKSTTSSVQTQSVATPAPVINLPVATVTDNSVSSAAALANIVAPDTSSSSAALAAVSSPLSKYVVWPGYDTGGFDVSNVPAGSAEDCASACTGTPGCQWFSWGSDVSTCWMKKGNSYLTDLWYTIPPDNWTHRT